MKNRRFAVKALIILVAVVAVCMIFSGTVQNILTPKVRIASVKNGKLSRSVTLEGKLQYSDKEDFYYPLSGGDSCVVTQVYVRTGDKVREGDALFSMSYQDPDTKRKSLDDAYREALEEQLEFERKNGEIRLTSREENYAKAYYGLQDAVLAEAETKREAIKYGVAGDVADESGLNETALAALKAYREAKTALESARKTFQEASRYSIDEDIWSQIVSQRQVREKVEQAEEAIEAFEKTREELEEIKAPHDGYVVEVNLKAGDVFDGISALCALTSEEGTPQLTCEVEDSNVTIARGSALTIDTPRWGSQKVKVASVEINKEGKRVAIVNISEDDDVVMGYGSLYAMTTADIPMKLSMEVASNASLLPSSAVHGAEGDKYVFIVRAQQNTVGSKVMTVQKLTVTVIAEADGTTAVQEDISYSQVAYMEDRELSDGSRVMEYLQ